ncbi:zinc-ribbon domain-containing protein [Butyrivibrio sp. AC2005]|uniref:zinc-ribbon domain-containing protein n=1 Tax=Butyrivibrio sp. AC2005 TaxID=1280672 RepID=UPI00041F323A|nr:zinc-ribbon domain-containing protein [Butyrivibrio sp. AC2005]
MAIYCNNCGTELPDGAAFCDNCGQTLQIIAKSGIPEIKNPFKNIFDKKKEEPPKEDTPMTEVSKVEVPETPIPEPPKAAAPEPIPAPSVSVPQPTAPKAEESIPAPQPTTPKPEEPIPAPSIPAPAIPASNFPVIPIVIAAVAILVIGIGVGAFFLLRGKVGEIVADGKEVITDKEKAETTTEAKKGLSLFSSGADVTQTDGGKIKWDQRDTETMDTINVSTEEDPLPENYMVGTWLKCYENIDDTPNMFRTLSDNQSEWKTNTGGRVTFADDGTYIAERWYLDNPDAKTTVSGKYYFDDLNNYEDNKLQTYVIILYAEIDEYRVDPGAPEIMDERLERGWYETGLANDKALKDELLLTFGSWTPEYEGGQYYRKITNEYHPELFNVADLQVNTKSKIEQNKNANEEEVTLTLNNSGSTEENDGDGTEESGNGTASISFGSTEEDKQEEIDIASNKGTSDDSTIGTTSDTNSGGITFGESKDNKQDDSATGNSSSGNTETNSQSSMTFGDENTTEDSSIGSTTSSTTDNTTISTDSPASNEVTETNNGTGTGNGPATNNGTGPAADNSGANNDSNVNSPAGDDAAPPSKAITGGKFDVLQSGETIYYMMNGQQAQDMWVKEMDKYYYIGFDKCLMYNNYASDGYYVGADGAWDKYIPRLTTTDKLQTGTYVYENGSDSVAWKFTMSPSGTYDGTAERVYSFGYSENYGVIYKGGSCYMLEGNGIYGSGPQITVLNGGERFIITDYGYSDRFTLKR